MSKFILIANVRTGSTSLAKVLGASPDVNLAMEPFHKSYSEWNPDEPNYIDQISDEGSLDSVLSVIFSKYDAVKVLTHQLPIELYKSLIRNSDKKFIFLSRRKSIDGVISRIVAGKTGIWQKGDGKLDENIDEEFSDLDIAEAKRMLEYVNELTKTFEKCLRANQEHNSLIMHYEDLFSEDAAKNTDLISEICDFLDITAPSSDQIDRYMKPSSAQINYQNLYKKIANYGRLVSSLSN